MSPADAFFSSFNKAFTLPRSVAACFLTMAAVLNASDLPNLVILLKIHIRMDLNANDFPGLVR